MSPEQLVSMASAFDVLAYDRARFGVQLIRVERRNLPEDPPSWRISNGGASLNRDEEWEVEGVLASSRGEDVLERTRWPSAQDAIAVARAHMAKFPLTGYPDIEMEYPASAEYVARYGSVDWAPLAVGKQR